MKAFAIYGGPGCGKTATLMKVVSRLKVEGYAPEEIGFVSHTRAAAEEALQRLGLAKSKNVCTIHSMAFNLLGMSSIQVVDHKKLRKFSELINVPITGKRFEEDERSLGDEYMDIIGYARNKRIKYSDAYVVSQRPGKLQQFVEFANGYGRWKDAFGFKDFHDMLHDCLEQELYPKVRALIIDEAQDLSTIQWDLIHMFLRKGNIDRVYIAGDDDQSINSWAGSEPDGMQKFEEKYNCERVILEKSYRLPTNIHALCKRVISDVDDRVDKNFSCNGGDGIIEWSNSIWKSNIKHGEQTMVLARTHRELRELEDYFVKRKLPYTKVGSFSFYENKYARAALIYAKIRKGGVPNDYEIRVLESVGTPKGKAVIGNLDFEAYGKLPIKVVLNFPYDKAGYYMSTDFSQKPTIKLMTIHASKGHESDVVVVNSHLPDQIMRNWGKVGAEETRLMYVALSRCKARLHVILHPDGFKFNRSN